jgi:hypothetical protein
VFFVDESGSIPGRLIMDENHKFFIIAFVHTDNPKKLKNTYKRAISTLKKKFPEVFLNCSDPNEMKGSECPPFMKYFIFNKLVSNTDIKIGYMCVNTWGILDRFRDYPERSFNYLVKVITKNFPLSPYEFNGLQYYIDNRNSSIPSLKSLEDYLYSQLVLDEQYISGVSVEYVDSKNFINVQVADMVANTIYQYYRYKDTPFPNYNEINKASRLTHYSTVTYLYNLLSPKIVTPFHFPLAPARVL